MLRPSSSFHRQRCAAHTVRVVRAEIQGGKTMERLLNMIVALHVRVADRDRGATATEYALLVAFIALVIVAGVTLFGNQLNTFFSDLGSNVGIIN
jgi:pilus assembly protein Flp/PilA